MIWKQFLNNNMKLILIIIINNIKEKEKANFYKLYNKEMYITNRTGKKCLENHLNWWLILAKPTKPAKKLVFLMNNMEFKKLSKLDHNMTILI